MFLNEQSPLPSLNVVLTANDLFMRKSKRTFWELSRLLTNRHLRGCFLHLPARGSEETERRKSGAPRLAAGEPPALVHQPGAQLLIPHPSGHV